MVTAYIGLGSNLGDREALLQFALSQCCAHPGIQNLHCSSWYETTPVGPVVQGDFLNAVAQLDTTLDPLELLALLLQIERKAGRTRDLRWGPRTLDLDLLDYDQRELQCEALILPHPEATKRPFVLAPWAEIAPEFLLGSKTVSEWLAIVGTAGVRRIA